MFLIKQQYGDSACGEDGLAEAGGLERGMVNRLVNFFQGFYFFFPDTVRSHFRGSGLGVNIQSGTPTSKGERACH